MSYFKAFNDRQLTPKEVEKIKVIQKHYGALEDGLFGEQTLDSMYRRIGPKYPYMASMFGADVLFSDTILPVHTLNKKSCASFEHSISGTFQYKNVTSSHLCIDGNWIRKSSTHDWLKQPETVLYLTKIGEVKAQRCLYWNEIKDDVVHAVGGLGLHNYDVKAEGFIGPYADVLRKTSHTAIGHDGVSWVGVYVSNMTGPQVKSLMIDKLKCKVAIMLDGGHIGAINSDRNANTGQLQNNLIQFI